MSVVEILQALRMLDKKANAGAARSSWSRRQARRQSFEDFRVRRTRRLQDPGSALPR